ncbi:hypothetical protein VNO77_21638 [Canavalia gladiata]|uniref:Uncharacterized protein n=1 Tax=Canavalia gladiata TaxID=3824 RepID=A0AAN9LRH6_CANGL
MESGADEKEESSNRGAEEDTQHYSRGNGGGKCVYDHGMAGGLETLCGQAFGAEQYEKFGLYTYTAVISLTLIGIRTCWYRNFLQHMCLVECDKALSFVSVKWWACELLVLLAGLFTNPKLETSVLSIW